MTYWKKLGRIREVQPFSPMTTRSDFSDRVGRVIQLTIFLLVVLSSVIVIVGLVIRKAAGGDPWQQGDWLINYTAGFVRRGLFGHGVYFLDQALPLSLSTILFIIQITILLLFLFAALLLFLRTPVSFPVLMVAVSPAFLFFPLWDFQGGLRKDLLALTIFAWMAVWSRRSLTAPIERALFLGTWAVFPAFLAFNHEGLIFFFPMMFVVFWMIAQELSFSTRQRVLVTGAAIVLTAVPTLLAFLFPGNEAQAQAICESVQPSGFRPRVCWGAIEFLGWDLSRGLELTASVASLWFLPAALLALVPFFFFRFSPQVLIFAGVAMVATIPAFILGGDWGRWIYLYVSIASIGVFRLVGTSGIRVWQPARALPTGLLIALFVIYASSWHLPHCCATNLQPGVLKLLERIIGA